MEYSQTILLHMERCGVTPYKLAKDTGISESLFSKWKSKPTSDITYRVVTEIAEYFGVSPENLLGIQIENRSVRYLSDDENEVIDLFRVLDDEGKSLFLRQLRYAYESKHPKAKFEKKEAEVDLATG